MSTNWYILDIKEKLFYSTVTFQNLFLKIITFKMYLLITGDDINKLPVKSIINNFIYKYNMFLIYLHQWHNVTTLYFKIPHFPVVQKHHIRWLAPPRIQRRLKSKEKETHLSFVFFNLHGSLHFIALVQCNKTFLI